MSVIKQFYLAFPKMEAVPLWITGESYGGHYGGWEGSSSQMQPANAFFLSFSFSFSFSFSISYHLPVALPLLYHLPPPPLPFLNHHGHWHSPRICLRNRCR